MKKYCLWFLALFAYGTSLAAESDKWIVVTTINPPTESVKKLAQLDGWHLVVVADLKTPKDWHLENCEFLSVEKQQSLPYQIIPLLPWNHYCRKIVGYLYAIEHGATFIYETDDDNLLYEGIPSLDEYDSIVALSSPHPSINVYTYFGNPQLWPRGFPLDQIFTGSEFTESLVPRSSQNVAIEQGLVNGDPDVDAITRLTRRGDVEFSRSPPCILFQRRFCPFNSQNTLFHYEAFWGLYLPATTSFRVCDIWRSYFAQRILWDMGYAVCFMPPSAVQVRNPHNYLRDFQDEIDLYLRTGELIRALTEWKDSTDQPIDHIRNLVQEMVSKSFLGMREVALMDAWIQDLLNLGYRFPELNLQQKRSSL